MKYWVFGDLLVAGRHMNEEGSEFGLAARFSNCIEAQMVSSVVPGTVNDYTSPWTVGAGGKTFISSLAGPLIASLQFSLFWA